MPTVDPIHIKGLRELQAGLRQMDGEAQKRLRLVLNDAADLVVASARRGFPTKTGRAKSTIRATSSQREARIKQGGRKAPYAPWLDYGGRVGRRRSTVRPFVRAGRYLYPAYSSQRARVQAALEDGLVRLCRDAGLTVEG